MNTRIVIADDEQMIRQTLVVVVQTMAGFEVVGQATNGHEALELCAKLRPHLLVADLRLPKMDAPSILRRLRERALLTATLIYTGCVNETLLRLALRESPLAFVHKNDTLGELQTGLHAAARGQSFMSTTPARLSRLSCGNICAWDKLTPCELEVLKLICEGQTTKLIADILGKAEKTVEHQRDSLRKKLRVQDTASLVRVAAQHGLLD